MSETQDILDLTEDLIYLDRKVAQFEGSFFTELRNEKFFLGVTFSKDGFQLGQDSFAEGEVLKPHGLRVTNAGNTLVMFEIPKDPEDKIELLYTHVGLDIDQLGSSFPYLYKHLSYCLSQATGNQYLGRWLYQFQRRIAGKPALIEAVQKRLKEVSVVNAGLKVQEREQNAKDFYSSKEDFGSF